MKVALELQPCCGNRSGIGTYTYEIARRLKDGDGLEFCGNLFNFCGRDDNSAALQGIEMPVTVCRLFPYGVYRRMWNYLPVSYRSLFPQNADLSIFFNYIVPPRISGKVMSVIHDLTYLRYPETVNQKNLNRIRKGIDYSLERSDRILTVSDFSKEEIHTLLGIPKEKISVVCNASSCSQEMVDFSLVAQKYGLRRPYVLYVGTIEPRKNLVRLIRAFDRLKRECGIAHQLVLAGGKGWQSDEIYRTAQQAAARDDIVFTGFVSQGEKNALYKNASAFVFPSLYEGFGIPPLEAMEMDCPVVCADAASLPEVVGDAAQLVNPLDEVSIAEGLWRVLADEDHAANLIQKGRVQKNRFTWDESARRLTELCRTVLGET